MKLTKHDLTRLKNFQRAKERAPTATNALWRVKPLWLAIIVLSILGYWISPSPPAGCFVLGLGAGGLVSAFGIAFIVARFWPLTREILNWEKIEQLIREHDAKSS